MAAETEFPTWLKGLPLAPEYRPTETEFSDPIAFISRIEREAAAFGICKVIPPLPRPSKKFVLANLNRSLSASPDLDAPRPASASHDSAVFTTRQQELGSRRDRSSVQKQVWQSGEFYTLEQFEAKSKAFARSQLGSRAREASPLEIEALFWKAAAEKPIYVEYANDVPGSGFSVPQEEPLQFLMQPRRKRKKGFDRGAGPKPEFPSQDIEHGENTGNAGGAGWKLSNSPWNLQVIARAQGSLTRFMPDEVPGVTSPMVYIGMLFSWFAWHVEDHELHSLNFLHMGSPKTWYAVPGDYAASLEETFRVKAYGGNVDRLAALTLLGEKTTLLSPDVLVSSGLPCCRLVQHPGEFVVTFPRAYHVGFSHGFNCGEAANFATPQWLKVAKEAAVRRAAMNYLPMLSHQQLLYMLTISFISRAPRELISGARSSRLKDRKKEEREILVKKAFLEDMLKEDDLLSALSGRKSSYYAVLWEPELLPSPRASSHLKSSEILEGLVPAADNCQLRGKGSISCKAGDTLFQNVLEDVTHVTNISPALSATEMQNNTMHEHCVSSQVNEPQDIDAAEGDLPFGLNVDSGSLACVACGILGYPLMAILQPSEKACKELFYGKSEGSNKEFSKSHWLSRSYSLACNSEIFNLDIDENIGRVAHTSHSALDDGFVYARKPVSYSADVNDLGNEMVLDKESKSSKITGRTNFSVSYLPLNFARNEGHEQMVSLINNQIKEVNMEKNSSVCTPQCDTSFENDTGETLPGAMNIIDKSDMGGTNICGQSSFNKEHRLTSFLEEEWNTSDNFLRPRIFCLQHALEIDELMHDKGGARVLIICHSDYLKIKALAISIAEEINVQLNFKEFPLKNASLSDLNLINTSIDDEGHEEDGKDWTARLGINLNYCVKLRKETSSNQEHFALSLGGMFLDPSPSSVISNLKWLSRKPRTPYKVIGIINENAEKAGQRVRHSINPVQGVTAYQNRKFYQNSSSKHRDIFRKHMMQVSIDKNEIAMADDKGDQFCRSAHSHVFKGKTMENMDNLINVPVSFAEQPIDQGSFRNHRISTSSELPCLIQAGYFPVPVTFDVGVLKGQPKLHSNELSNKIIELTIIDYPSSSENQLSQSSVTSHQVSKESSSKLDFVTSGKSELLACSSSKALQGVQNEYSPHGQPPGTETPTFGPKCRPANDGESFRVNLMAEEAHETNILRSSLLEDEFIIPASSISDPGTKLAFITRKESDMHGNPAKSKVQTNALVSEENIQQGVLVESENDVESAVVSINGSLSTVDALGVNNLELQGVESSSNNFSEVSHSLGNAMVQRSRMQEVIKNTEPLNVCPASEDSLPNSIQENNGNPPRQILIQYVRRRNKRKREDQEEQPFVKQGCKKMGQEKGSDDSSLHFIRSPCEGLRPRIRQIIDAKTDMHVVDKNSSTVETRKTGNLAVQRDKCKGKVFRCDIEGCKLRFETKGELSLHKRNRCTFEGCSKRFSSHMSAVRHQCVHNDDRPLECSWSGCNMTFKWAWARTEHMRLHTGERPYVCKVSGCGQTFRFVSDFSRHRRKTGHQK